MNIYKILCILVLSCAINEGLAWFFGGGSSSSSQSSSSGSDRSSSNSGGSGWWGGRRNSQSKPSNPSPNPKPKPNPPAPAPKPQDSGNKGSGWFWGSRRNPQSKPSNPSPNPKPKPNPPAPAPKPQATSKPKPNPPAPAPKPQDSGNKGSGWFWGSRRNPQSKPSNPSPTSKPKPNPPVPAHKPQATSKPKPNPPAPAPKPQANPKPKPNPPAPNPEDMKKVIEVFEGGSKLKAYDAQPNDKTKHDTTIGIGFNMNRKGAKETFNKVLPGVDFNKVKSGEQTITEKQARALYSNDIDNIYVPRAKSNLGKDVYDKLPANVKTAVVNAFYRGDIGPKTIKHIKDGNWKEVGKEYLDHDEYRNAVKLGKSGVKTRMDWNKEQFDTMIP